MFILLFVKGVLTTVGNPDPDTSKVTGRHTFLDSLPFRRATLVVPLSGSFTFQTCPCCWSNIELEGEWHPAPVLESTRL
jgi:hypothetical protein